MTHSLTTPITPPTQEIVFAPAKISLLQSIIIAAVLSAAIIFAAVQLSPFFLILLLGVIALFISNQLWIHKGSLTVTKTGIISRKSPDAIIAEVQFKDVYKVVVADRLVRLAYRNSSSAYGIIFVNAKGDALFKIWTFDYSKQDIQTLLGFFREEDIVKLGRVTTDTIKKILTES